MSKSPVMKKSLRPKENPKLKGMTSSKRPAPNPKLMPSMDEGRGGSVGMNDLKPSTLKSRTPATRGKDREMESSSMHKARMKLIPQIGGVKKGAVEAYSKLAKKGDNLSKESSTLNKKVYAETKKQKDKKK